MQIEPTLLRPLGRMILVEVLLEDHTTEGGLIVPDNVAHASCQGIAAAIGPEVENVAIGDHILFEPYQENRILPDPTDPTREFLLINADTVLCLVEE